MENRRVVVTGVGAVSCFGVGVDKLWDACLNGETSISPIPAFWKKYTNYESQFWSPLPEFDYLALGFKKPEINQYDQVSLNMLMATEEALSAAHIETTRDNKNKMEFNGESFPLDLSRLGVYVGTGMGGASTVDRFLHRHHLHSLLTKLEDINSRLNSEEISSLIESTESTSRYSRYTVARYMVNAPSAAVGLRYGVHGPVSNHSTACASGTVAVGNGFRSIKNNLCDVAIVGATEHLNDGSGAAFKGFDYAGTLTRNESNPEKANRPFDKDRSGFLFSEGGAGALILEEYNFAKSRGAPILAEISGFEETFDAFSIMAPEKSGDNIANMLTVLLKKSNISASDVSYINAHGTGTHANDIVEANVLERIFGSNAIVNSSKSILGHTIGASGALEAVISTLSIQDSKVHVSKNIDNPICDLNFAYETRDAQVENAMSYSLAFGGHNAGLLFRKIE